MKFFRYLPPKRVTYCSQHMLRTFPTKFQHVSSLQTWFLARGSFWPPPVLRKSKKPSLSRVNEESEGNATFWLYLAVLSTLTWFLAVGNRNRRWRTGSEKYFEKKISYYVSFMTHAPIYDVNFANFDNWVWFCCLLTLKVWLSSIVDHHWSCSKLPWKHFVKKLLEYLVPFMNYGSSYDVTLNFFLSLFSRYLTF